MYTDIHQVSPENILVTITEFKSFFTVGISFENVEAIFPEETDGSNDDDDVDLGVENIDWDDPIWDAPIDYEGVKWVSARHSHSLFFYKDLPISMSRDEILMKLKLAFPNHEYRLVED